MRYLPGIQPVRRAARLVGRLLLLLSIAISALPGVASAQSDAVFDLLGRVNALRRQNGLAPLELNDPLAAAAQRHSQDMANTGRVDHTGSDGSAPEQRMIAAGYGPALNAWGENIYGSGIATVGDAWGFWTTSSVHRNNLLSERYREIGIGVATSANGTYYTLKFGARPGVLPFFVDQGSLLDSPVVALTLSNEDAAPGGSSGTMGRAVEIRAGEGEDFSAAAWQPWQPSIPFTLSNVAGEHRVTVEYRDSKNTIVSYFRIVSLAGAQPQVTPIPSATLSAGPSATALPPTATLSPTDPPTAIPTSTPTPSATPPPSATFTPSPMSTFTPTPLPTATSVSIVLTTTTPGSTPAPSGSGPPETSLAPSPAALAPTSDFALAPIDRSPIAALVARGWSDAPMDLLGLIAGLQIAVVVIGAAIIVRRSMKL
ncbi:MAG: CAP domain-containing protein [Anaerolineae bacterium]